MLSWPCAERPFSQQNLMPMALECFCFIVPLMIPLAVLLPVFIGAAGCGWPMASRQCLIAAASLAFKYGQMSILWIDNINNECETINLESTCAVVPKLLFLKELPLKNDERDYEYTNESNKGKNDERVSLVNFTLKIKCEFIKP